MLATLLGGFASPVRADDPDVVSPLTSYIYLDTLADQPSQENIVSPLAGYLYQDSLATPPDQPNVTSPLVSYLYQDFLATPPDQPNVISPLVSYLYLDTLAKPPDQPNVVSPLVSYLYYDWPGDENLTFQNSPLVSYFYQFSTTQGSLIVHGRVTDLNGLPLSGATVSAMIYRSPITQATSDANGNYQLPSLGAGVYDLSAWDATHQTSMRGLTLNANTIQQDFQLKLLPPTPATLQVNRSATVDYTVGDIMDSVLRIFDGTNFVPITANNWPSPNLKTIVMTHGWQKVDPDPFVMNTPLDGWPPTMAANLESQGINTANANIVAWDWRYAASTAELAAIGIPTDRTSEQGVALGEALQFYLGANYVKPLHFLGHSLGTLVNASAINYLHNDNATTGPCTATPWMHNIVHVTLFDQARLAAVGEALLVQLPTFQSPLPVYFTWAENYKSIVGVGNFPNAVNVNLQKGTLIAIGDNLLKLNLLQIAPDSHTYSMDWYGMSITNPLDVNNPLGFKRSYEYSPWLSLPSDIIPNGSGYYQTPLSDDVLALSPVNFVSSLLLPDIILQSIADNVQQTGDVTVQIVKTPQNDVANVFNYLSDVATQGKNAVVDFFDSTFLNLKLVTAPQSASVAGYSKSGIHPDGLTSTLPMAWLPIQFPTNPAAMTFDFTVEGDPADDVLVCGIGTNNLFSLSAKYIPTNQFSSTRFIDVSAWSGTTNELFFGFLGGTSSNATLQIQNIRFYSLQPPKLAIAQTGNVTLLAWPGTAGGYEVATTTNLTSPDWETVTNAPAIVGNYYVLTNSWADQTRFFRLQQQ